MSILANAEDLVPFAGMALGLAFFFLIYFCFKVTSDNRRRTRIAELQAQAAENEARLKSLMIQRGMSADEIERVLKTGAVPAPDFRGSSDEDDPEARIVKILAENGYAGDDVERILKAARVGDRVDPRSVRLVETLAENWSKASDIERVLRSRPAQGPAGAT